MTGTRRQRSRYVSPNQTNYASIFVSTSKSNSLFERALELIPGGVNSPVRAFRSVGGAPFFVERANGATLTTADGRELIDFVCTWGPAIHGHNHPVIRDAIATALEKGTSFGTPNPYEVEMAGLVTSMVPSIEKVRMCNSGTEATMSCVRLARGATSRDKIVKFSGCYHGHVDSLLIKAGSGALTLGNPDSAGIPASFARETIVLALNDFAGLDEAFAKFGREIAGVIIEPYPANVGLILPEGGFLKKLRDLCTANGSILIFDEVMTGFRLAPAGVQQLEGITPDLTALGKIIGGGLPVGAFGGRADIMDNLAPLGPVYQAGTLSGNPLAMAAGIAALNLLRELNPYDGLAKMGAQIAGALASAARTKGVALQVPQVGSMFALFFNETPVRDFATAVASDTAAFRKVFQYCLDNGVYLPPSPFETCFISTAHEGPAVDRACETFSAAIAAL
jgi:glutamate-1-semialdehyde 2,1-aminomutase